MKNPILTQLKKTTAILLMFLFQMTNLFSQSQGGTWTWMSGDAAAGVAVYGTQGVSSASNKPPGLLNAACWTDLTGRFWLYGGAETSAQVLADLWMFDPSTQMWMWVKGPGTFAQPPVYGTQGVSSPANTPGARKSSMTWVDNSGNLWLFGGAMAYSTTNDNNDLWKYSIATNEWTWMKGSNSVNDPGTYGTIGVSNAANNPACRGTGNATWTDNSGNLWLFGGGRSNVFASSVGYNDLWKYDVTTNNWTWMSGSNIMGDYGSWGTMGVPNATNRPGIRATPFRWKDNAGNLWLFGGLGVSGSGASPTYLMDLWKYDISTNMWTWVSGTQQSMMEGSMATSCSENNTNHPSARYDNSTGICMVDKCGNFWLYAGSFGMNWNDEGAIWRYNPSTNKWAWSGNPSGTPNYGTLGVSNTSNNPPAPRPSSNGWFDLNGNLWAGFGTSNNGYLNNDLWKFTPDYCSCVNCTILNINATSSSSVACPGSSVTLTASGANNYTWSPSTGLSSTTGASVTATPSTTTTYTVIGTSACASDTTTLTITVGTSPVSVNSATICSGSSATLTATGATTYSWSPSTGLSATSGSSVVANPSATTTYTIIGTTGTCTDSTTATVTVGSSLNVSVNSVTICSGSSATLTATGATTYSWSPSTGLSATSGSSVTANPSATTTYTIVGTTGTCTDTTTATVTVGSSLNVVVNSATICSGSPATLTATGATTYSWSPSAGLSATSGSSVVANPSATTTYTIVGTTGTCTNTTTATVTVSNSSNANFSYSGPYCQNSTNPVPQLVSGASAGLFAASPSGLVFVNSATGQINLSASSSGTYTITNTLPASGVCPVVSASATVTIAAVPNVSINSATICAGQSATLTATPSIAGGTYSWSPGNQTTQSISTSPNSTTNYTVTYSLNSCTALATSTVSFIPSPIAAIIAANYDVLPGDNTNLTASGGGTYVWSTGETTPAIFITPTETTVYCVTVQNNNGCSDSTCVEVKVTCSSTLYVPNCFTPNGDLVNELFIVPSACINDFHIMIYNRWGQLIFESTSVKNSWDGNYMGKPVPDGVYVYVLEAKGYDNTLYKKSGHVTVLR